jgi:dTMP kinase
MGINLSFIKTINNFLLGGIKPNFTFLNIVNKKNLKSRLAKRKNLNRYDKFKLNFYNKAQSGFIKLSKINKKKYLKIDSNIDITINKKIIINKIDKLI